MILSAHPTSISQLDALFGIKPKVAAWVPDYPHIRRGASCPICKDPKAGGLLWCWPCHNETQRGTAELRAYREDILVVTEERLAKAEAEYVSACAQLASLG
jgi:hypothetical protein